MDTISFVGNVDADLSILLYLDGKSLLYFFSVCHRCSLLSSLLPWSEEIDKRFPGLPIPSNVRPGWMYAHIKSIGVIDLMKWLCRYNFLLSLRYALKWNTNFRDVNYVLIYAAAKGGCIDMLEWMESNLPFDYETVLEGGITTRRDEVIEWALKRYTRLSPRVVELAAEHGNIKLLSRASGMDSGLWYHALQGALTRGQLETVKWIVWNGGSMPSLQWLGLAASGGNIEVVDWVLSKGVVAGVDGVRTALMNGHINVAQRLVKEMGCTCIPDVINDVIHCGNLESIMWLWDTQKDGITTGAVSEALLHCNIPLMDWMHERGVRVTSIDVENSVRNGNCKAVRWLCSKGYGLSSDHFTLAIRRGHTKVAQVLLDGGVQQRLLVDDGEWPWVSDRWLRKKGLLGEQRVTRTIYTLGGVGWSLHATTEPSHRKYIPGLGVFDMDVVDDSKHKKRVLKEIVTKYCCHNILVIVSSRPEEEKISRMLELNLPIIILTITSVDSVGKVFMDVITKYFEPTPRACVFWCGLGEHGREIMRAMKGEFYTPDQVFI